MEKGYYQSPMGLICYEYEENKIHRIDLLFEDVNNMPYNDHINNAFDAYFKSGNDDFKLQLDFSNLTEFRKKVLSALLEIPYGKTCSYSDIATKIGNPKAVRAVGQACRNNPFMIIVPCHRVIGKNNELTGYSGKNYIYLKQYLLNLERKFSENKKAI